MSILRPGVFLASILYLIILLTVSGTPTEKVPAEDATTDSSIVSDVTEVPLEVAVPAVVNVTVVANSTFFRQEEDEDDEDSPEEEKENEEPEHLPNLNFLPPPQFPIYPHPLAPKFNVSLLHTTTVAPAKHVSAVLSSTTASSAAAEEIRYSVSRIPIPGEELPTPPTTHTPIPIPIRPTVPQKYKITNKPSGSATTTVKTLSFAEEWNLTNIFHTAPEGRADCACGKLPFKVDNADKAGINQFPWTVAVVKSGYLGGGRVHCSGTLVNNYYVATTSQCVDSLYSDGIQIWLTAHNAFQADNFLQEDRVLRRDVSEILMHPNFQRNSHENDIALIKLKKPVDISVSSYYVPICLPAAEQNYVGQTAKMAGWGTGLSGTINSGRIYNTKICKEDVPVISNDVCNRDTRHNGKVTSNMMCAGLLTPQVKESCFGDSGGPLMVPNGGRYTLVGVVSWGFQNRQSYSPVVYTKVAGYADWILHNTRDADWCGS